MTLMLIDWLIIVLYMAGCLVAGLWMRRYVRGVEEFALAALGMIGGSLFGRTPKPIPA